MSDRANFYEGGFAETYESERAGSAIWEKEHSVVGELLGEADLEGTALVLDVPVGTGRFLPIYQEHDCRLIGIDMSQDMLALATQRSSGSEHFVRADITKMPLADASIDASICIRFIHLVNRRTVSRAISEFARTIKPGGTLILGARVSDWQEDDGGASRVVRYLRRKGRVLRFVLRAADSRPHSKRWLIRTLANAGLAVVDTRLITRYSDGSQYVVLLIHAVGRRRALKTPPTIELFGMPGSGKTTIFRALTPGGTVVVADGFAAIEPLSLYQCLRQRPIAVSALLLRLIPVVGELRRLPARQVAVVASRQLCAKAPKGSAVIFQEGVSHEVWRKLIQGHNLSDSFIRKLLPVADLTVFIETSRAILVERLNSKPYPGPISRTLMKEPTSGDLWDRGVTAYVRIRTLIESQGTAVAEIRNDGRVEDGVNLLSALINEQVLGSSGEFDTQC